MMCPASQNQPRTVLMLSPHFPPRMSAGVFRLLRFVRFLPQFGWQCVVIGNQEVHCPDVDRRPYEETDLKAEVHRFQYDNMVDNLQMWRSRQRGHLAGLLRPAANLLSELADDLSCPDKAVPGIKRLYNLVSDITHKQPIDAVWITGPPYSWFLAGPRIFQRLRIPVLLDLRDPWTIAAARNAKWQRCWRRPLERRLERWSFKYASRIILNTPGAQRAYAQVYPDLPANRWAVITNGFEPEDLADVEPERFSQPTLVHGGMTLGRRSSCCLFEALARLRQSGCISPDNFRYVSFGNMSEDEREVARRTDVDDMVEFRGGKPHKEVLAAIRGAAALLLLVSPGHEINIPGKLYEYLATERPILMAGPACSDAAEVIRQTNRGTVIENNNIDGYIDFVKNMVEGKLRVFEVRRSAVSAYTSLSVTSHLACLLDEVTARIKNCPMPHKS